MARCRRFGLVTLWLAYFLLSLMTPIHALTPISIKGTKLYDDTGNQFFIKGAPSSVPHHLAEHDANGFPGVAYSGSESPVVDLLLDTDQCQIDAGLMKTLGVNTIRVYYVDSTKNHDGCMQAFASQGIYVWLELTTPTETINRVSSWDFFKRQSIA